MSLSFPYTLWLTFGLVVITLNQTGLIVQGSQHLMSKLWVAGVLYASAPKTLENMWKGQTNRDFFISLQEHLEVNHFDYRLVFIDGM